MVHDDILSYSVHFTQCDTVRQSVQSKMSSPVGRGRTRVDPRTFLSKTPRKHLTHPHAIPQYLSRLLGYLQNQVSYTACTRGIDMLKMQVLNTYLLAFCRHCALKNGVERITNRPRDNAGWSLRNHHADRCPASNTTPMPQSTHHRRHLS